MIKLNKKHPDYDPAMELLAMLPVEPDGALMRDLIVDLRLKRQADVRELAENLKQYGVAVRNTPEGRVLAIPRRHWVQAYADAKAYLDRVESREGYSDDRR